MDNTPEPEVIRKRSERIFGWFGRYARRFLRKGFHAVRILSGTRPKDDDERPLVVYCNHPSWNDPMVLIALGSQFFPDREHYGPIDEDALQSYGIFKRLGLFGVKANSLSGTRDFLRNVDAILRRERTALWITAQGRFADVRERPVRLQPGLGAALHRAQREVRVFPLAMEYVFGEERYPEVMVAFGSEVMLDEGAESSGEAWTKLCEAALEETQDRLAMAVVERDQQAFEELWEGAAGLGGVYGIWQRTKAVLTGRKYDPRHGSLKADER